jgi:transmembrane sensor
MKKNTTVGTPEEAAYWCARLCAPDCTDRDRADFERWLRADPSHADAFAAAQLLSDGVGLLADVDPRLRALADEAYAIGDSDVPLTQRLRHQHRRWSMPLALAATLAVAVVGLKLASEPRPLTPTEHYSASTAPRQLMLADGSRVLLDVDSQIRVALESTARRVELMHGRALFTVAHDRNRPFSVTAGDSKTTALGTVFQVQRDADAVTVTLSEGSVAVTSLATDAMHSEKLAPGEQIRIDGPSRSAAAWNKKAVDPEIATSWTHGRLVFRSTPLAEAIAEMNRYSDRKLALADSDLADLTVSGNFIPGENLMIASAFTSVLPIRTVEVGNEILLFRRHDVQGSGSGR